MKPCKHEWRPTGRFGAEEIGDKSVRAADEHHCARCDQFGYWMSNGTMSVAKFCRHEWKLVGDVAIWNGGNPQQHGVFRCLRCDFEHWREATIPEYVKAAADRIETLKLESDFHAADPR